MSNYAIEKIKSWFRSRKWKAVNTNGGFLLTSPVSANYGLTYQERDSEGNIKVCHSENYLYIENSYFSGQNQLDLHIYGRECYYKKNEDNSKWIPTNEFSEWHRLGSVTIQAASILKLAELIKAEQKYWNKVDLYNCKSLPKQFLRVDRYDKNLIGVNVTREEVHKLYTERK